MPQYVTPWSPARAAPAAVPVTLGPSPQWVLVGNGLLYSAFTAASTTSTIALFSLPAAAIVHGIKIKHTAAFTGGSVSACTMSVGDVGNATLYASAFNVYQAPSATAYQLSNDFGGESLAAATQLYVTAVSTGANLSALTAGAVNIFALLSVCAP